MADTAIPSETLVLRERVALVSSRDAGEGEGCSMEHRLGTRVPTSLPVRLVRARAALAHGRMLNASSSGAYIETSASLRLLARIDVVWGPECPDRAQCPGVPAYVARVGPSGVGVEWLEFAPAMIRALLGESEGAQSRKKTAGAKTPKSPATGAIRDPNRRPLGLVRMPSMRGSGYRHADELRGSTPHEIGPTS